jgi:maltose alpha-D-glucosyltransferase/alpha-amylase
VSEREARIVSSDRLGISIAFGTTHVLKLYYRMEEGTAPELEVGRYLDAKSLTGLTPRVLGSVEYRVGRNEPVTLAIVEEFVLNEGTAWQHARSELGRAYERVLAQPAGSEPPDVPTEPILDLAYMDPPPAHAELIGAYRNFAMLLGRRTAELHLALSASTDPSFEPHVYTAMDQRSKYQTARNLVGRVLASMRRSLDELPSATTRAAAEQVLGAENAILARFEPLLTHRIDATQIRYHGDLHLGRALFTGKDFVILDVGGARDRRLSERRRKAGAFRDVAGMLRSFHYAAATTLHALRSEDQTRAEAWGWIWQRWASAAFLRGYLDTAKDAPFIPKSAGMKAVLLDTGMLEKAFAELRNELKRRPEMAWVPLQGILRMMQSRPAVMT